MEVSGLYDSDDHLLARECVPPLLVTPGTANKLESTSPKNCNNLVCCKPGRIPFTQASPQQAWHRAAKRVRKVRGKGGSPLQCSGALLLPCPQPTRNPVVPDTPRSNSQIRDQIRGLHGTSQTDYTGFDCFFVWPDENLPVIKEALSGAEDSTVVVPWREIAGTLKARATEAPFRPYADELE